MLQLDTEALDSSLSSEDLSSAFLKSNVCARLVELFSISFVVSILNYILTLMRMNFCNGWPEKLNGCTCLSFCVCWLKIDICMFPNV